MIANCIKRDIPSVPIQNLMRVKRGIKLLTQLFCFFDATQRYLHTDQPKSPLL